MLRGVLRLAALGAFLAAGAGSAAAASPPAVRISGLEYVSLEGAASALGMRAGSSLLGHTFTLTDRNNRVEFEPESHEIMVNGLRVFLGDPAVVRDDRLYVSRIDFERCLLPMLRPQLIGPAPRPPRVIAIDPGHGGPDHGAENLRLGLMEKTFTLDTALRLRKLLETQGYRVVLTRDSDPTTKLELPIRALIANQAGADLFLSIHFDSLPNPGHASAPDLKTRGVEIFSFTPRTQRSTAETTEAEAESSPVNRFDAWSVVLAQALHREVLLALRSNDRGKKLKHLGVLRGLNCPGILIEGGFLSSDTEAREIATPAYRQRLAEALAAGIHDYGATLQALQPAGPH